ncbi:MAG: hypothetical protein ACREQK_16835 [Candidatus Binatia bacterium]
MSFGSRATVRLFLFVICLALLAPAGLPAKITIDADVGFAGLFQLGQPFPLRINLGNTGTPVEGTVEVQVWKGGPARGVQLYPFLYKREVFLSAQARRSVDFTVDPDFVSRPLLVTFSGPGGSATKEIDLRRHFSPASLILLVSGGGGSLALPSGPSPILRVSPAELPGNPRALRGVWAIVFYDQPLGDLSKSQMAALEAWLGSGGRMVILGGLHYAVLQEPAWARFLPVEVSGLRRTKAPARLEQKYGAKIGAPEIYLQTAKVVSGAAVIEENGSLIVAEAQRGKGRVHYVAADLGRPPLSQWAGLSGLFSDLLGTPPERDLSGEAAWNDAVFNLILYSPVFLGSYAPAMLLLAALVLYLLVLAVLAWLLTERGLAPRLFFYGVFAFVPSAALAGYVQFHASGKIPNAVVFSSTVLDALPDGSAESQSNVALFSTRRRAYDLRLESGWTDFEIVPSRPDKKKAEAVTMRERGVSSAFHFLLKEWDYRLFKIRGIDRFPLRSEFHEGRDRISLRLTNQSSKDLEECWVLLYGRRFSLGDLPAGASQERSFSIDGEGHPRKAQLGEVSFKDKVREMLLRASIFAEPQGKYDGSLVFLGWVRDGKTRVSVPEPGVLALNYTLFRMTIPLQSEEEL